MNRRTLLKFLPAFLAGGSVAVASKVAPAPVKKVAPPRPAEGYWIRSRRTIQISGHFRRGVNGLIPGPPIEVAVEDRVGYETGYGWARSSYAVPDQRGFHTWTRLTGLREDIDFNKIIAVNDKSFFEDYRVGIT